MKYWNSMSFPPTSIMLNKLWSKAIHFVTEERDCWLCLSFSFFPSLAPLSLTLWLSAYGSKWGWITLEFFAIIALYVPSNGELANVKDISFPSSSSSSSPSFRDQDDLLFSELLFSLALPICDQDIFSNGITLAMCRNDALSQLLRLLLLII